MTQYADQRGHDVAWMTAAERDAIARIVAYDWAAEERDYGEQDQDGRQGHVFLDLQAVGRWLESASQEA